MMSCSCCKQRVRDEQFLRVFHALIPEMEANDDTVLEMRDLSAPMVSKKRFGDLYVQALCYLVAHRLAVQEIIAADGAGGDGSSGALSTRLMAGAVTSEKEGDLQRSYGAAGVSSNDGATSGIDLLDKTAYGAEFKRIRSMCIVTGVTRFG